MAASTTRISIAACFALTATITASALPMAEAVAQRGSGRVEVELAYRGSGRLDSRQELLAYRGSGRLSAGLEVAYRGSERGIQEA